MTNQAFFRSCEVVMFHKKLTTSLIGNNNLIKNLPCYRGRHISNNITQLSKVFQRCYKLFKLFIYKGFPSTTSQKVSGTRDRERKNMHVGRRNYTSPGSCTDIPDSGDRANVKFAVEDLDIHFGRLAVSFGKPLFWNLFDYYGNPYLNQEYKAGIDALRLDKAISNFSGVNIVINKRKILTQSGNYLENSVVQSYQWLGLEKEVGLLLRGYTTIKDTDYALLYKREPEGHRIGIEVDGEIGSVNFYDEITYLWGSEKISMPGSYQGNLLKNYLMNVLGINYRFNNNLQITAEYLFNGIGNSDNLDASNVRYKNGVSTSLNDHLSGVSLSYEFNPLLVGQYDARLAWDDSSHQHNFSFVQSITDNVDFIAGGQINIGDRPNGTNWQNPNIQSEFGRLSNTFYLELKCYF